jgi:hypothetical protein
MGDPEGARRVLQESASLIERYLREEEAEIDTLTFQWLEGRIARNLGEHEKAERILLAAAEGLADFDMSYDTALVLLDLADSYLATRNVEAVKKLVPEIEPLLVASDLDQEIIAALMLFQSAIQQELLSTAVVSSVRRKIEKIGRGDKLPQGQEASN